MKPLSKGDACRVRLHTGEVVEAVYDEPTFPEKDHYVNYRGIALRATKKPSTGVFVNSCRFVAASCDLVPVGVKV